MRYSPDTGGYTSTHSFTEHGGIVQERLSEYVCINESWFIRVCVCVCVCVCVQVQVFVYFRDESVLRY